MQVLTLNISSQVTVCELFAHYASQAWSILLDSGDAKHENSRYDIFVAEPTITLETKGKITTVTTLNSQQRHITQSEQDPLSLIQQQLNNYSLSKLPNNLPFIGGAVGYWAYDLGKRYEVIGDETIKDIQAADMAVGIYLWCVIRDNDKNRWVLVDHTDNAKQRKHLLEELALKKALQKLPFALCSDWQSNMTPEEYQRKFNRVKHHIKEGDCYQINLAQRFQAKYSGDEWLAYLRLREENKAPFSSFIRLTEAAVLSVSPERFLQLTNHQIETKPIKGTRPRYPDRKQDQTSIQELQHSEKDKAENLMIVDLLRNDIGKVAKIGSVSVPKLFEIESFPSVHHLVSTIQAQLAEHKHACDLLKACFPGGSITGAPKVSAMKIIEQLEPHHRSVYCGSIGYIDFNGNMDSSITIRTLVCHQHQIYCWAGGGLVYDSSCANEYQETFDKLAKILPILKKTSDANE